MKDTTGIRVGDIVRGVRTGNTYEVLSIIDRVCVRTRILSLGYRPKPSHVVGRTSTNHVDALAFIEHGSATTTPTNTTTKENTTMDNSSLNTAINNLASEEATNTVRPVFKRISTLVRATKVGEALVITRKGSDDMQFYCRLAKGTWLYGNGTSNQSTEETIATITRWVVDNPTTKVRRLVKEAK